MSFIELGLSEKVLKAVEASGYDNPTPIQAQAIPLALQGRDVLGIAQTGTGKTAAFTLPMLSLLEKGRARARMPRTLILEPTRELAAQVEESFARYGINHKLNVALLIGGVSFGDQETKIARGADVLIATPGRLLDFAERGKLLLTGIEILVIDEADRMLDMGFIPDIERICKLVPFTRQTLFFSATMPPEITRLTEAFLHNPARIEVARQASTAENIAQWLVRSSDAAEDKRETLRRLIGKTDNFKNALIFCNRKRDVQIVYRSLEKHGLSVGALHGDLDQRARMAALDAFRAGQVQLLVCSDVAARGLDIPDVSHVINYDAPHHEEDYVHRIGRTGRAGRSGVSFTIVTPHDDKAIAAIERLIHKQIPWFEGTGAHPEKPEKASAAPVEAEGAERGPAPRRSRRHAGDRHAPRDESRPQERERHPHSPREDARPRGDRPSRAPVEAERPQRAARPSYAPAPSRQPRAHEARAPARAALEPGEGIAFGGDDFVPSFLLRPARPAKPRNSGG
jgi:superfamily II DNA/RNA helicase